MPLNILVTNDDGINVPGLWLLVEALRPLGKVTVVAPDREQSGVGQAISLAKAMRMHRIPFNPEGVDCYSVEGTPGDAVILALGHVLKNEQVDLVVSGVNRGANTAAERFLSGTVGAAWHGLVRGLTAIAASAAYRATDPSLEPAFDAGAAVAGEIARGVAEGSAPQEVLYNLNAPLCTVGQLQGLFHARPGQAMYGDEVREEDDGRGKQHYYLVYKRTGVDLRRGSEDWALRRRTMTLTVLDRALQPLPRSVFPQAQCDEVFRAAIARHWPIYAASHTPG